MTTSTEQRDLVLTRLIASAPVQVYRAWTESGRDRMGRSDPMPRSAGAAGGSGWGGLSSLAGSGRQVGEFRLR
jgi:hypothetical protein